MQVRVFNIIVTENPFSWDYPDGWHVLFKDYTGDTALAQYSGYAAVGYPTADGFQFAVAYEGASAPFAFVDYNKHNQWGTAPYKTETLAGTNAHIAYFDSATILDEYNAYLTDHSEAFNPSQLTIQAKAEGTTVIYGIYAIPPKNWVKLYYSKKGEQVSDWSSISIPYNAQYMNSNYDLVIFCNFWGNPPKLWLDWKHSGDGTASDKVEGSVAYFNGKTLHDEYTGTDMPSNLVVQAKPAATFYGVYAVRSNRVSEVSLSPDNAQTITVGGEVSFTASVQPDNAADKTVKWSVSGTNADAVKLYTDEACTAGNEVGADATSALTVYAKGISAGSATVTVTSNADSTKTASCGVTVSNKAIQTITAADVTAAYGDTDKAVSASVTAPATGGGTISYTVKDGSGEYIDVASDGKLTIKKVPASGKAYVIVKAAETDDCAETTKEVTVNISTKVMTVSASDVTVTVDGQPHGITVNVTEPATGYTVKYGTAEGTYDQTTSPTQTQAGELTVYYQVTADNYTTYTGSAKVTVSVKQTQTITASDVTATYGDTGKKINASVTSGGGTLKYEVKSGDAVTVNETTGALTIVKAGSAVITVTAAENDTYAKATKDVNVTVNTKAMTVSAADVNVTADGQPHGITVNVTDPATGATVKYGTTEGTYDQTTSPTQTEVGEKTVYYQVTADNYTTTIGSAKVTVNAKQTQTITADNVTATYGDTDKKVTAMTNGNGAISYAVKDGSGDYIDVDASTGALTIKKVGTATVIVTAAETSTYAQATKEVTVTINKANAVAATVTANNRTYDGTEKPLVTVTGEPTGGTMQYALGTDAATAPADELYTTSIPAKTDAGT